jgi:hypothetical protein
MTTVLGAAEWRPYFFVSRSTFRGWRGDDLASPLRTLLVFGCLAFAPSKKCCCCLLTKFGLAYFSTRLFGRLADGRHLAFNIFDALPTHTVAAAYPGPINTTGHN